MSSANSSAKRKKKVYFSSTKVYFCTKFMKNICIKLTSSIKFSIEIFFENLFGSSFALQAPDEYPHFDHLNQWRKKIMFKKRQHVSFIWKINQSKHFYSLLCYGSMRANSFHFYVEKLIWRHIAFQFV